MSVSTGRLAILTEPWRTRIWRHDSKERSLAVWQTFEHAFDAQGNVAFCTQRQTSIGLSLADNVALRSMIGEQIEYPFNKHDLRLTLRGLAETYTMLVKNFTKYDYTNPGPFGGVDDWHADIHPRSHMKGAELEVNTNPPRLKSAALPPLARCLGAEANVTVIDTPATGLTLPCTVNGIERQVKFTPAIHWTKDATSEDGSAIGRSTGTLTRGMIAEVMNSQPWTKDEHGRDMDRGWLDEEVLIFQRFDAKLEESKAWQIYKTIDAGPDDLVAPSEVIHIEPLIRAAWSSLFPDDAARTGRS